MGVHNRASAFFLAVLFVFSSILIVVPDHSTVGLVAAGEVEIGDCPRAADGYGYDPATATFVDHNGFAYSYLPDGVVRLVLPWGYTTYFSYGLTGTYLGVAQKVTALSYSWTWTADAFEAFDANGNLTGYDYSFTATNSATLAWTIRLDFFSDSGQHMKVTHSVRNGYPAAILGAEFWYLFDLTHTPSPSVTTHSGTYYPPLYADLPDSITWARLSNQFQFDWRDAGWPNGHAYLGSGSVVGLPVDILGVSLDLGEVSSGETVTVDPYFSGVSRTWAATGNSDSNTASNWSPAGVPATGDNITFDSTSVFNCNWNTAVTLGDFKTSTGYSGTISQSASYGAVGWYLNSGTFTGSLSYWVTVENNITKGSGGAITSTTIRFNLTGATSSIGGSGAMTLGALRIYGSCTVYGTFGITLAGVGIYVHTGASIIIPSTASMVLRYYSTTALFINYGSISGAGTFTFNLYQNNRYLTPGTLSCPVTFTTIEGSNASRYVQLTGPLNCGYLTMKSTDLAGVRTTTLKTGGYQVSFSSISLNPRGAFECQSGSPVRASANWDTSAGTFIPGTSTVYLTGTASTVKTATGESFYNLIVGGTYTTQSGLNCSHLLQVNASKSLTAASGNTVTADDLTNLGQIIGAGSLVVEATDDRNITLGTVTTAPTTLQLESGATDDTAFTLEASCSLGAGLTIESDHASYEFTLFNDGNDLTLTGGDLSVASDANLLLTGGTVGLADDFSCAGDLISSATDYAVTDDCALSGSALVYGGSFEVDGVLNVTGAALLNPTSFGLWAVRVLGSGSLSVTNLSLSVAQDLYVGSGASLTVSDDIMSIGGNLTVLGDWTRGDNWLTMTGTGTLEMVSTESFYNITIAVTATITMDNDTYVDLRATVLGTMLGAGDFIEPLPAFLTSPDLTATPLQVYNYSIDQQYWDALVIEDGPAWLTLYGSTLMGVPTEADAGPVNVSLSLTWNDMTVYQNWTLWVSYPVISESTDLTLQVVLALILGLAMLILGLAINQPIFTAFSGIIFLWAGLAVFAPLGFGWTAISILIGFATLILGGLQYGKVE